MQFSFLNIIDIKFFKLLFTFFSFYQKGKTKSIFLFRNQLVQKFNWFSCLGQKKNVSDIERYE